MQCRLRVPIVASNAGSIPEVGGDAVLLSAPGDVAALAANLTTALYRFGRSRAPRSRPGDARWREFTWQALRRRTHHRLRAARVW